jgi:hypothetical protein
LQRSSARGLARRHRGSVEGRELEVLLLAEVNRCPIRDANLHTLRDRKLARVELFFDQAEALEAAGLRE